MRVSITSKGEFENVTRWLKNLTSKSPETELKQVANEGVKRLASATPKRTGETASGWYAETKSKGNMHEIAWKNRAHPELNVNLAKLIETGHGTKNGGYVPPTPYIKQSMGPLLDTSGDKIAKGMIK